MLHTKAACSLFNGSWQYKYMGLLQFAKVVNTIYHAAKHGDTLAELHLKKIQEEITKIYAELLQLETCCQHALSQLRGFEIRLFSNPVPSRYPILFSSPLGYQCADMLGLLDYIVRIVYTLRHFGVPLSSEQRPARVVAKIRAIFVCRDNGAVSLIHRVPP